MIELMIMIVSMMGILGALMLMLIGIITVLQQTLLTSGFLLLQVLLYRMV